MCMSVREELMICETLRWGSMLAESITELHFSEGLSKYENDISRDVVEEVVVSLRGTISQ